MVPVGPRSLTVTALSSGEGCFASSRLKFQVSGPPAVLPHSRAKLRSSIGDIVRHCVGKSCPALSSELGFVTLVVYPLAAPSEDRRRATYS